MTTVFFDRSIGTKIPAAFKLLGLECVAHDDIFRETAADTEWLPDVSRRGWAIITNDKQIRFNEVERRSLVESGAAYFVLGSGSRPNRRIALTLLLAWDAIQEAAETATRPFAFTIHANGRLAPLSLDEPSQPS